MAEKHNNLRLCISCSGNFASQLINESSDTILCYGSGTCNISDVTAWHQEVFWVASVP